MFKRTRLMAMAALAVGALTACDEGPGLTEVTVPVSEAFSTDLPTASLYYSTSEASAFTGQGAALVTSEVERLGDLAIQIVGPSGGMISTVNHTLVIPPGAVGEATEFTMEVLGGSHVLVDMSARSVSSGEAVSEFPVPLTLTLSYKGVVQNSKAKRLKNVYLYQDSPDYLIPLPSVLDKRHKTISSEVWHFSLYGMAIE